MSRHKRIQPGERIRIARACPGRKWATVTDREMRRIAKELLGKTSLTDKQVHDLRRDLLQDDEIVVVATTRSPVAARHSIDEDTRIHERMIDKAFGIRILQCLISIQTGVTKLKEAWGITDTTENTAESEHGGAEETDG